VRSPRRPAVAAVFVIVERGRAPVSCSASQQGPISNVVEKGGDKGIPRVLAAPAAAATTAAATTTTTTSFLRPALGRRIIIRVSRLCRASSLPRHCEFNELTQVTNGGEEDERNEC